MMKGVLIKEARMAIFCDAWIKMNTGLLMHCPLRE